MTIPEAAKIHEHAVIGNGRSVALVTRGGTIDWLCWPRFESPPLFGGLLDRAQHGWRIAPVAPAAIERAYITDTNVLVTRFATATGRIELTDLMPVASEEAKTRMLAPDHEIVRRVVCDQGTVELDMWCEPQLDFGRARTHVHDLGRLGIRWEIGTRLVTLRATVPIALAGDAARCTVVLSAGESIVFSLAYDEESPAVLPPLELAGEAIARSVDWWRTWTASIEYGGPYRDSVVRGALALKLMAFAPSGAIIAAPTMSLPERIGGSLNYDYRYCWLRDAAFTARALLGLGYVDDAAAYCSWLLHTTRLTRPELRNVYDVYGNAPPPERILPIAGYRDSQPVRTGCINATQLQLDTYGEVIDAVAMVGRATGTLDRATGELLRDFGGYVCEHWQTVDAGIWEPREAPRHRTHSRLLCWVALDRLIDLHDRGLVDRLDRDALARHRAAIREDIEAIPMSGCSCTSRRLAASRPITRTRSIRARPATPARTASPSSMRACC